MRWDLEQVAERVLEEADARLPINPDRIARHLELVVQDGGPGCEGLLFREASLILVDDSLRPERRAFAIAHELGHWLSIVNGFPNTEANANYLAAALLLPRDDFERHLRRWGWDLIALHARHRLASFEVIARRIVALRSARAFVFDKPLPPRTEKPKWYSVPGGHRPRAVEREAAREAALAGAPVEPIGGVTGWPVLEHDWHRVIVVSDEEAVS